MANKNPQSPFPELYRAEGASGPAPVWPMASGDKELQKLLLKEFFLLQGVRVAGGETSFDSLQDISCGVRKAVSEGRLQQSAVGHGEAEAEAAGGTWESLRGTWEPQRGSFEALRGSWDPLRATEDGSRRESLSPAARIEVRRRTQARALGRGMGYHADLPDQRDWVPGDLPYLLGAEMKEWNLLPEDFPCLLEIANQQYLDQSPTGACHLGDGNTWLWPVEDQGMFQSCTANAVIGAAEFLLRRDCDVREDLSRLFLYTNTRKLLGWTGDTGAYLRETIKALQLFGAPPEVHWPHTGEFLNTEPTPFAYQYAQEFSKTAYLRLDSETGDGNDTLRRVKAALADGFPVVCGFPLNRSIALMGEDFVIPDGSVYDLDRPLGGHAVLCVGFDDGQKVASFERKGPAYERGERRTEENDGALIIRNSWGVGWGDLGFAYLPYNYVRETLAVDFWALLSKSQARKPAPRQSGGKPGAAAPRAPKSNSTLPTPREVWREARRTPPAPRGEV